MSEAFLVGTSNQANELLIFFFYYDLMLYIVTSNNFKEKYILFSMLFYVLTGFSLIVFTDS